MKKFFLFSIITGLIFCSYEKTYALSDTQKATVKYDIFSPEKSINASLNASPIHSGNYDYYLLPLNENSIAYASNVETQLPDNLKDPYIFNYKGENYIFIKTDNTNKITQQNILGINDTKETLFYSLFSLDKNNDEKITVDELNNEKIRIMKIDSDKKLVYSKSSDFNINKISYIDLKDLKKLENSINNGINAHFRIHLKKGTNQKEEIITGMVISAQDEILKLF